MKKTERWGLKSPEGWLVEGERGLFTHSRDVRKATRYATMMKSQEALLRASHSVETGAMTYERIRETKVSKKKTVTTWFVRLPGSGNYVKLGEPGEADTTVARRGDGATEFETLDEAMKVAGRVGGEATPLTRQCSEKKKSPPLRRGKKPWIPAVGEIVEHELDTHYGAGEVKKINRREEQVLVLFGKKSGATTELWCGVRSLRYPKKKDFEPKKFEDVTKTMVESMRPEIDMHKERKGAPKLYGHDAECFRNLKPCAHDKEKANEPLGSRPGELPAGKGIRVGAQVEHAKDSQALKEDEPNPARLRDPKAFDAIVDRWKVAQARADELDDEGVSGFGHELSETRGLAAGLEWALNQLGVVTLKKSEPVKPEPKTSVPLHWVVEVALTQGGRGFLKRNEKNAKFIYAKEPEDGEKFTSEDAARAVANSFISKTHKRAEPMPIYLEIKSGMPDLIVPVKVLAGLERLLEAFVDLGDEDELPEGVKPAQVWIRALMKTMLVPCDACGDSVPYAERKKGLCRECAAGDEDEDDGKSEKNRQAYHEMLDRAMDATAEGRSFLPKLTEFLLSEMIDLSGGE